MRRLTVTLLIALLAAGAAFAEKTASAAAGTEPADWPQFRGPNRDGISPETGLLESWPEGGPEVLWRVPLGSGFSAIAISEGRLYTQFGEGKDEYAAAFDTATGKQLWRVRTGDERRDQFGNGPRSTPTVDGGRVFVVSALGQLHALDARTGKTLWQRDLREDFGAKVPTWGVSASPIILGERLLLDVGGKGGYSVVAFDKKNGEVVWHAESDIPGYSTPIEIEVGGVRQVVFFTGRHVMGLSPDDGKTLWKQPWKTSYDVNAATPIFVAPDKLFVSSGYDTGAALFRLGAEGGKVTVEEVWRSRSMKNQFSSSVYLDGTFYGFNNKVLTALDADTGEVLWRKSGLGHGSLLAADDHLVVLGESGQLVLAEATPEGYVEKASAEILSGKHWTVPTLYDGRLYVRNERELLCLKVAG